MTLPIKILDGIEKALHPIRDAVVTAVADVKAQAEKDRLALAKDVQDAVTAAKAAITEATPEIEAAVKKGAAAVELAVKAALAAHGL